jgi:hypothetical protein
LALPSPESPIPNPTGIFEAEDEEYVVIEVVDDEEAEYW